MTAGPRPRLPRRTATCYEGPRPRVDAADLPSEHEHHLARLDRGDGRARRPGRGGRRRTVRIYLPDRRARAAGAARALQPRPSRGRPRHRLPVLPHDGRDLVVRRHTGNRGLHELPQADLVRGTDAGARPRELPHGPAAPLEPRLRPPRLRLFRPQHPRGEGRRLRQLPRARGRDAAPVAREHSLHELVPRLSRRAVALRPPARARLRPRLAAERGPGDARAPAREGVRHHGSRAPDQLLRLPPMTELDAVRSRLASARGEHYWRTLEEVADSAAFQELLARELPAAASLWLDPTRRRSFLKLLAAALGVQRARHGAGLRILTETVTSPTLGGQLRAVLEAYPEARWHQWEPARADAVRAGTLAAFGDDVRPLHRLADADVIVALDADFLGCGPAHLAHVREFAARRRPGQAMNRLYVAESGLTPTGAKADHRLPVRAADVALLARALAAAAGGAGVSAPPADQIPARWVQAVAHDLGRHRGRSLVVAGETQPAEVQALAHPTNAPPGHVGHTVAYVPAAEVRSEDQLASLHKLVDDMAAGRVELLVVLGGDSAFNAPADLPFAEAMAKVPLRVHLSLYANDTPARSHWVVPAAHYLESWGDVRAFDGTVTIVQPLIAPLYAGESAPELLAVLAEGPARAGYDIVRTRWQAERRGADFDDAWRSWLEAGIVPGTALATRYG